MEVEKLIELVYLKQLIDPALTKAAALDAVKTDYRLAKQYMDGVADDRKWLMTDTEIATEETEKQNAIDKSNSDNDAIEAG